MKTTILALTLALTLFAGAAQARTYVLWYCQNTAFPNTCKPAMGPFYTYSDCARANPGDGHYICK
jgi:hypothetical protein